MRCCPAAAKTLASSGCGCIIYLGHRRGRAVLCSTACVSTILQSVTTQVRCDAACQLHLWLFRSLFGPKRRTWNYKAILRLRVIRLSIDSSPRRPSATSGLTDFLQTVLIPVLYNYMDITDVLNLQRFRIPLILSFQSNFTKKKYIYRNIFIYRKKPKY